MNNEIKNPHSFLFPHSPFLIILCRWLVLFGFSFILVFGPLYYGAVKEWQISTLAIASVFIFVCWALSNLTAAKPDFSGAGSSKTAILVFILPVLFIVLIIFQLVPLPGSILGFLSPVRYSLKGSASISLAPYTTRLWLIRTIALSVVFVIAAQAFTNRKQVLYILVLIVVLGYLFAIYGLLQHLSGYALPAIFEYKYGMGRVTGTYVNSNHFAGYLEMCTPLAFSIVFLERSRTEQSGLPPNRRIINFLSEKLADRKFLLPLTAVVLMSLAIIFSISRMGIFSFTVSLMLFAVLLGAKHKRKVRAVILISVVAAILAVSLWLGLNPVLKRYSLLSGDSKQRVTAWKMTADVIRDYPLMGTGLGTFTHISPNYQTPGAADGHWRQSHNDYLNLTSDTGIAGLALAAGFLLAWYIYVLRLLAKRKLRTYQRSIAAGCIAGVSAIVIHSIADFNLQIPANAFYFATLLGLAIAVLRIEEFPRHQKPPEKLVVSGGPRGGFWCWARKVTIFGVTVLLIIVIVPMTIRNALSQSWLAEGRKAKDTESRIHALKNSISLAPNNHESHYRLGMIEYTHKKDYKKARDSLAAAVYLAPCKGRYHFRLGMAHSRLGNDLLAEKELTLAMKLAPTDPGLHFNIGFYHFFKGRRTRDKESVAAAFVEFRKAARISAKYLGRALGLVSNYFPQYPVLKNLVPYTPRHHLLFANYLAAKAHYDEALKEYKITLSLKRKGDPSYRLDADLCLAMARCHLMTGDLDAARRGYMKALSLASNPEKVFSTVLRHFAGAKLTGEGLELLLLMKEKLPRDEALDLAVAKFHFILRDYDTAERQFLQTSETRPSGEIYRYLFEIAIRRRDYNLLQVYAQKAIRYNPSEAGYHAMLARAKEATRDFQGALHAIKQALAIQPENSSYKKQLKRINQRILSEKK